MNYICMLLNTVCSINTTENDKDNENLKPLNSVSVYDPINPLPKDRLEFQNRVLKGPFRPILDLYPRSTQNHKQRSFQKNWYDHFDWLEYSSATNSAFCFPCRLFKGNETNSSNFDSTFSKTGFSAWYRGADAFKKHQTSKCHINSVNALSDFTKLKSIDCVLDKARQVEISMKEKKRLHNRSIMKRMIDISICLAKSGRPFRGHDEKESSNNQGLFKELVILLTKYDDVLKHHFKEASLNALYTSNRIQNDLITSIKHVVLQNIKTSIQNSFISIIADETSDVGNCEQLSIVIRYFDEGKNKPVETFITLNQMKSVTAQSIFESLNDMLKLIGKNWNSVLSTCFDGASTMAGKIGGVQAKCKAQNSKIYYVHCYAHCLNLALVNSVCDKSNSKHLKKNRLLFNFFGTVQITYNFIESSPMRHATLQKISNDAGFKLLSMKSCSVTRWACRAEAVRAILNNYEILLLALDEICENSNTPEIRAKGLGVLYQLRTFDFIFGMYLMNPVLNLILKVSSLLQSPKLDLLIALNSIQSLVSNLKKMRQNAEDFKIIFDQAVLLCNTHQINIPEINNRKVSIRIDNRSNSQFLFKNKYDELKISVYYQLLDDLISGINLRFDQETVNLIQGVSSMLRLESIPETTELLSNFANVSNDTLTAEIKLIKYLPADGNKPDGTTNESLHLWLNWLKMNNYKNTFSCFYRVLQLFSVIPVTSCSCERAFSKLTIVKNKLRSTMKQDRLDSLLLLFVEQELTANVDTNEVIDTFKAIENRRILL